MVINILSGLCRSEISTTLVKDNSRSILKVILNDKLLKIKNLKISFSKIPKVLFGHDPETFFQSKCFGIVPEKNFWHHAQSIF